MRVCQFRHFGTGHQTGVFNQFGSIFKSRKRWLLCQIRRALLQPQNKREQMQNSLGKFETALLSGA